MSSSVMPAHPGPGRIFRCGSCIRVTERPHERPARGQHQHLHKDQWKHLSYIVPASFILMVAEQWSGCLGSLLHIKCWPKSPHLKLLKSKEAARLNKANKSLLLSIFLANYLIFLPKFFIMFYNI